MAVVYDSSAKSIHTATSTCVLTITIAANACVVVGIHTHNDTTISSCTITGTPLNFLGRTIHSSNGFAVSLFGLMNAPSGAGLSLSCQTTGAATPSMGMMAASYTGAGAFGDYRFQTASAVASVIVSFSTSTTDVIACYGVARADVMTCQNATRRQFDTAHLAAYWYDTAGPSNSYSLSWSCAAVGNNMVYAGVNLIFSVTAVNTRPQHMLLLGC
jgi:hypothetical protein